MSERTDDLRATAEDLIADAERLKRLEQAKLALTPGDSRLARLAAEAQRIVRRMAPKPAAERELADGVSAEPSQSP